MALKALLMQEMGRSSNAPAALRQNLLLVLGSMNPTYLFLDTEWADAEAKELVSLALVSADGQHRFYAERDPLPTPTEWVRANVYPLLDRGEFSLDDAELTVRLREFLCGIEEPYVLFDHVNDGRLLRIALDGLGSAPAPSSRDAPVPEIVTTTMIRDGNFRQLFDAWFKQDPSRAERRHHAAVDAEALREAWLVVTGRKSALTHGTGP